MICEYCPRPALSRSIGLCADCLAHETAGYDGTLCQSPRVPARSLEGVTPASERRSWQAITADNPVPDFHSEEWHIAEYGTAMAVPYPEGWYTAS